jgi:hypothetical protein
MTLAASIAAVVAQALTIAHAELDLAGPLRALEIATPRATLVVEADLDAGERRRAVVPFLATDGAEAPALRVLDPDSRGRAELVRRLDGDGARAWAAYPPATRARPRGLPDATGGSSNARPPLSALLLAAAWLPLALAVRRRPVALAAGALATGAAVAALVALAPIASETVRVLEGDTRGDSSAGTWLEVLGSRGEVASDPRTLVRVDASAPVAARIGLASLDRGPLHLGAPGSTLFAFSTFAPGARAIASGSNRWGDLDRVWTRTAAGEWSEHGAWALGAPMPAGRSGAEPPGWLNPALPMGTGVLIARSVDRPPDAAGRPCETWLRVLGFGD